MPKEQMVEAFAYGNHIHYKDQPPCRICEAENAAFMALWDQIGTAELEKRIDKLPATKRFYQALPFTNWADRVPFDSPGVDSSESLFKGAAPSAGDPADAYADLEATVGILAPLTASERYIIQETVKGNKPKEIASNLGQKNSNMVRLGKYEAKRKLGVPVQTAMRRNGNKQEEG